MKFKTMKTDYTLPQSKFKTVDDILKWTKKRQKGKGAFVKLDAGNVERNAEIFNHMMGSDVSFTSGNSSAESSVVASSGVGMGESLNVLQESTYQDNSVIPNIEVTRYIEQNASLLDSDPEYFIMQAFLRESELSNSDIANLLRVLHQIDLNITKQVADALAYDLPYLNYDSKDTVSDYLDLFDDVTAKAPVRTIDEKYWKGLSAATVFDVVTKTLSNSIEDVISPEDIELEAESIRIEVFVAGKSVDSQDRRIGIQLIVGTPSDVGVIELKMCSHRLLESLCYLVTVKELNNWMDSYKQKIEQALLTEKEQYQ